MSLWITVMFTSVATTVWLVLVSATVLSWALGTHHGFVDNTAAASLTILAIAFIKIRYVGLYFIDLHDAPLILRASLEVWCIGAFAVTSLLYLLG